jgi:hypothetical protein
MTPHHHSEIRQRDDGWFDVVSGDIAAGPFETIAFAVAVARGTAPESKPAPKFRRLFKTVREMSLAASA